MAASPGPALMDQRLDVIVSIVNYNTKDFLYQCLSSIHSASISLGHQIYVVDNDSRDGSREMVASCYPGISLIANGRNVGFARAHNQIIRGTDSRYVLLLNPDVIVTPGCVDELARFMDDHPAVGVLGCRLLNPDGSIQLSCREYPTAIVIVLRGLYADLVFPKAPLFRRYTMADWDHSTTAEVDWIMGSSLMLRRDALASVGLFDETFFMYYEDVDLCYRMRENWVVCYFPHVSMFHYHRQDSRRLRAVRQRLIHMMSAYRFFRKHGPFPRRRGRARIPLAYP
jgi:GT2 family glycosyltransferase